LQGGDANRAPGETWLRVKERLWQRGDTLVKLELVISWSVLILSDKRGGTHTPIAMERVRKHLNKKGLRASMVQNSVEIEENKGDEIKEAES
jgi:hypothetical protein